MKSSAIPIRYGLILGVSLIVYFLVLSLFGLHIYVWFSLFNGILTGVGIFMATRDYKRLKKKNFKYQKCFMAGLMTGFYATVIFTVFFAIYASNINPQFMTDLMDTWDMATSLEMGFGQVVFSVAIMGLASTFVLTLTCMQLFKDSWNTKKSDKSRDPKKRPNYFK